MRRAILTYTLILTLLFPASIFASQNGGCVDEHMEQGLIDEELLSELMLIVEDGVVEQEELENLFILIEEKWNLIPSEFIGINGEVIIPNQPPSIGPTSCLTYLYWLFGGMDSVFLIPIRIFLYCWYFFFDIDPRLKILFFILDLFVQFPYA
jgi:hypothetical protein